MTVSTIETPKKEQLSKKSRDYISQVRVIYADTDKMGHVYHSRYLHYFEVGRNEMLREIDFPYKRLEEENIYLPIIESHLNYYRPAYYDDLLTMKTCITQDSGKLLRFKIYCSVYRDDDLLTDGYTVHIISNSEGRPCRPSRKIYNSLTSQLFNLKS